MPLLARTFIKTALMYLALALALGIALAQGITNALFPVYIHLLVFGWLTQLIFGVVYWMFPKYSAQLPRGYEWLGWITYGTLNIGLFTRTCWAGLGCLCLTQRWNIDRHPAILVP